jgi:predicted enzyme related to lactoylglutathione lyase
VRLGGANVAALAKFYESAYGLQEIRRLSTPGNLEIMLNFGDSLQAAKSNPAAHIIIMHRAQAVNDPVTHLILKVTDMAATVAAVRAAGGSLVAPPREVGKSGIIACVAIDPAGNHVEMIQRPGK